MRSCGSCTKCCYFMEVRQLGSPPCVYCKHCTPDVGCSIWEKRPEVCRTFGCFWWHQEQLPEFLRPDNLGVMFELPPMCKVIVGYVDPEWIDAWQTKSAREFVHKLVEAGYPVVLRLGLDKPNRIYLPNGWTNKKVREELQRAYELIQESME